MDINTRVKNYMTATTKHRQEQADNKQYKKRLLQSQGPSWNDKDGYPNRKHEFYHGVSRRHDYSNMYFLNETNIERTGAFRSFSASHQRRQNLMEQFAEEREQKLKMEKLLSVYSPEVKRQQEQQFIGMRKVFQQFGKINSKAFMAEKALAQVAENRIRQLARVNGLGREKLEYLVQQGRRGEQ